MTDRTNDVLDDMDDLELITRMLNGQLDPERIEAVRRRLEEDAAFRELAAPMLLTWTVPRHLERKPRPMGELEREWEKFKRRPGVAQMVVSPAAPPRRARWPRWLAVLVLGAVAVVAITIVKSRRADDAPPAANAGPATVATTSAEPVIPDSIADIPLELAAKSPSTLVPYQEGWFTLPSGIEVQLEPGAELRVATRRLRLMRHMLLSGTARFRIPLLDDPTGAMRVPALILQTSTGYLIANEAEFTVSARPDTTDVEVHAMQGRGAVPPAPFILSPVFAPVDADQFLLISSPGRARLVRGENPVHVIPPGTTSTFRPSITHPITSPISR